MMDLKIVKLCKNIILLRVIIYELREEAHCSLSFNKRQHSFSAEFTQTGRKSSPHFQRLLQNHF